MKNKLRPALILLLTITIFALGAGLVSSVSAQESSTENVLIQKLDALVEQLSKLVTNKQESSKALAEGGIEQMQFASGVVNPSCLDNYETWPTSTTLKQDADWSVAKFATLNNTGLPLIRFTDVNGDGLVDYLYHNARVYSHWSLPNPVNLLDGCLLLNNGSGWDNTYRCHTVIETVNDVGHAKFYGDCAQL